MFAFGSWQGTAGSQKLELTVPNMGTRGYHCKERPVPKNCNHRLPLLKATIYRFPEVGTSGSQRTKNKGYHCKELPVPRGLNSWFPTPWNHGLPLQATAGSRRLELIVPNLCKTLSVTIVNNVGTTGYRLQGTAGSQRLELLVPNL